MKKYTITDGSVSASILPDKGATVINLQKNGIDFLYLDADNLASDERPRCGIPFLFPTFGRMQAETYTWEGKAYPMPIHGFAHTSCWAVEGYSEDSLVLSLTPDKTIRTMYPFPFRVELACRIRSGALEIQQTYKNTGTKPMPYAFGFHPYFLLEKLENAAVTACADAQIDFSSGKAIPFGNDKITLEEPENAPEIGAALVGLKAPVVLDIPAEHRRITMDFSADYPQLVLWHPKKTDFLCVEPINGSPNGFNTGNHLTLTPGQSKTVTLTIHPEII